MKTIKMPGFTAEASLSQGRGHYQIAAGRPDVTGCQAIIAQRIKLPWEDERCVCDTHTDICVCTERGIFTRVLHLGLGELY